VRLLNASPSIEANLVRKTGEVRFERLREHDYKV
jgi:hypothetical protein